MKKKDLTMTIPQFLAVQRGDLSYKDIQDSNKFERILEGLDQRSFKLMSFTMGTLMFATKRAEAATGGVAKAEELGREILVILQRFGLWICIIGCILEILVSVFKKNGGKDEIIGIVFKWFLILLALYAVPAAFIWIADYFNA